MTEKTCYTCGYFELQGNTYHSVEHCKLHNISQKHLNEPLQLCDDWVKHDWYGFRKIILVLKGLW